MTIGPEPVDAAEITVRVNGTAYRNRVSARTTLADHLREDLSLTGTKLGCEHGVCGACTILLDGRPIRSCLVLAVQADSCDVETVEGLAQMNRLNRLQQAFRNNHAMQCGFCTAGFLMSATSLLTDNPTPTRGEVVEVMSGNICRCTGYETIVNAVLEAACGTTQGAVDDH